MTEHCSVCGALLLARMATYHFILSLLFTVTAVLVLRRRHSRSRLPLPPGPKRIPFVGNLFNRPIDKAFLAFTDMKSRYGDIISLEVLGQPFIVLNSTTVVDELFEKRSANYADRPPFHMANDLTQWGWDFANMRYSEEWRLHRKVFHQYFQAKDIAKHQPIQLNAAHALLHHMLASPQDLFRHVRHYAGSAILRVVYGYETQPKDDALITLADKAIRGLQHTLIPGHFFVDFFPILKRIPAWFPFAGFKCDAIKNGRWAIAARDKPFHDVLDAMAAGTAEPCFVTENMESFGSTQQAGFDMTTVIKNAAGISFLAGADTTVSVVLTTILALIHHPELAVRAQAELDKIVGRDRLPNFDDRDNLRFIEAIILESMRWRPVLNLGIAHAAVSDDSYDGYFIPAGSIVSGNTWAILHDESIYQKPSAYNPDRFIGPNSEPRPTISFGYGRRICPGRFFAENAAFIAIASFLWAFDIAPEEDADGKAILPDVTAYTDGMLAHPLPFTCKITPRFEALQRVLNTSRS